MRPAFKPPPLTLSARTPVLWVLRLPSLWAQLIGHSSGHKRLVFLSVSSEIGTKTRQGDGFFDRRLVRVRAISRYSNRLVGDRLNCHYARAIIGACVVNAAAFFLTNSCTLSGGCPVSSSTSSDILSNRPARCRSASAARWFTT